jgi:hypothetical protein
MPCNLNSCDKGVHIDPINGLVEAIGPLSRPPTGSNASATPSLAAQSSKRSTTSSEARVMEKSDGIHIGGISDDEELDGPERMFAINSPPKGRKRITSEVMFQSYLIFFPSHIPRGKR